MKISKPELKNIGYSIITWTFLNLSLNLIGLFLTKLLSKGDFSHIESINIEFVLPLVIQSLMFGLCLTAALIWIKNIKYKDYLFVAFQFVMFHCIFFLNLNFQRGIHFESTFNNIGLRYLSNFGQYLVDILYLYFPINGIFENGLFNPSNLGTFYIHWILLNLVYYFGLTWLTVKVVKFFINKYPKVKNVPENKEKVSNV
jgi:hypothetical protein